MVRSAKADRRIRRTRELLRSALLSLILDKGYYRITVQDILDRADVGRSTFYAHYRDKDDLLQSGFEDIREAVAAEGDVAGRPTGRKSEFLQPLLTVFRHVERHRRFWEPLSRRGGTDLVVRILRKNVTDLVQEHLRSQFPNVKKNRTQFEAAVQFTIGAVMGLLIWWLDNDVSYSAEEIHSILWRLTAQGVRRYLDS